MANNPRKRQKIRVRVLDHGGQHAGIFSGTDLGAPVTGNSGTQARWVGKTLVGGLWANTDFVLEVTFGDNNAGSVAAFIPYVHGYWGNGHIYLNGEFNNTGLITGTAKAGQYVNINNNPRTPATLNPFGEPGVLHGLIGEEGAVGAFLSGGGWFAGGFVARPAEDVDGAALYLKNICESNPSHEFCFLPDARIALIVNNCNNNPFGTDATKYGRGGCAKTLGADRHETEKKKRISFCNNTGSALNDSRCKYTEVIAGICAYSPFAPVCLGNSEYSNERARLFDSCRKEPNDLTCHGVSPKPESSKLGPNAASWADSFVTESSPAGLSSVVDTATRSQFLKGGKSDLDKTGISVQDHDVLYFEPAPVEGIPEPSKAEPTSEIAKEGVAFFWGWEGDKYAFYAGILKDTDLGMPVDSASGTEATWTGKFQSLWFKTETDFELKIVFGDDNNSTIKATIENKGDKASFSHFFIDGGFDNNGLITGSILAGKFTDGDRNDPIGTTYPGILRGLIGKEGAVGAFVGGTSTDEGNTIAGTSLYSGGFIATPLPPVVEYADWVADVSPTNMPTANRFLAGTKDGLMTGNARLSGTPETFEVRGGTVPGFNPSDDALGGFAYYRNVNDQYVGLLSKTNLGAPLDATTAAGTWHGIFFEGEAGNSVNSTSFTLTVKFGVGDQSGQLTGRNNGGLGLYSFSADFNSFGVIDGTITRLEGDNVSSGVVSGLIGVEGAVGVFHSNVGATTSYIGGFLAHKAPQ